METYPSDAEAARDTEPAQWFRKIQEDNRATGEQGKRMPVQRLQNQDG